MENSVWLLALEKGRLVIKKYPAKKKFLNQNKKTMIKIPKKNMKKENEKRD